MADELKSFEQTHWLREYVAFNLASGHDTNASYSTWAGLDDSFKKIYRKKANERILEFKAAVEAAQRGE